MNKIFYPIFLLSFFFQSGTLVAQDETCNVFELLTPLVDGALSLDSPPTPCGFFIPSTTIYINQCSPCGRKISDDDCTNTPNPTLCELDGFQTTTGGFSPDRVNGLALGFCNGAGTIENNFWVGFTAQSNILELRISVTNCSPSAQGVQVAIVETDCVSTFTTLDGGNPCIFNGLIGTDILQVNNLVPGNPYFIMFDGFAGDVCEVLIEVLDGFEEPDFDVLPIAPGQLCPDVLTGGFTPQIGSGASVIVTTGGISTTDLTFFWLDPNDVVIATTTGTVSGNQVTGTLDGSFFDQLGTYTVEIIDNGSCCPLCTSVPLEIAAPPAAAAAIISGVAGMDVLNCFNEVVMLEGNPDDDSEPAAEAWTIENSAGVRVPLCDDLPGCVTFVDNTGRLNLMEVTREDIETHFPGIDVGEARIVYGFIEDFTQLCFGDALVTIPFDFREPDININTPAVIDCDLNPTVTLNAGATNVTGNNATFAWEAVDGTSPVVGDDTETPTVSNNGFYRVTVTDQDNGCVSIDSIEVMGMVNPPSLTMIPDTVINCINQSVTVSSTGDAGGAMINYVWTGPNTAGVTVPTLTVTEAGLYTLTATNLTNSCATPLSFNVIEDMPMLTIDAIGDSITTCSNTEITFPGVVVNGGAGVSTYSWIGPDMTEVSTDSILIASDEGLYTLTITDVQSGCTMMQTANIGVDENMPQIAALPIDLVLNCDNNLMVSTIADAVDMNGAAIPGLQYEWFDATGSIAITPDIIFTQEGMFTVVVTNPANGCFANAPITIGIDMAEPDASIAAPLAITCAEGTVTLTGASTNMEMLNYQWFEGMDAGGTALGTTITQDVSADGDYSLVITNTENGCTSVVNTNVASNEADPIPNAGMDQVLNCLNQMTGVELDGSGSTAALTSTGTLTYAWTDPLSAPAGTTTMINATEVGTYTLVVTDMSNGCTEMTTVMITGDFDAPANVTAVGGTITCSASTLNGITLMGGGPTGPDFKYLWVDQGMNEFPEQNPTVTSAGDYTLTVTNCINGCTSQAMASVVNDSNIPTVLFETLMGETMDISCNNPIRVLNGFEQNFNPNVVLTWFDPNGDQIAGNPITIDENSLPGKYVIQGIDPTNTCTGMSMLTISFDFSVPDFSVVGGTILCSPDEVVTLNAEVNDPTDPASFTWTNDATSISFTSGLSNPPVTEPGLYTVVATSAASGCTSEGMVLVEANNDPPMVTVAPAFALTCQSGEDTYQLNGAATTSNVGDALEYSWTLNSMPFSTDQNPTATEAGNYILTVTNTVSNCTETATVEVTDIRTSPIAIAIVQLTLNCNTPMVQLEGDSDDPNAVFVWTSEIMGTVIMEQSPMVSEPGIWNLVVTSDNGCIGMAVPIEVMQDFELPQNVAIMGDNELTCMANSVQLFGSTSSMDMDFLWSLDTDDSFSSIETSPNVGAPGIYTLAVTGNNGCMAFATFEVTVDENLPVAGADIQDILSCVIQSTMIMGTSTAANSSFDWSGPPGFTGADTQDILVDRPGDYILTIIDPLNGCEAEITVTVDENLLEPDVVVMGTTVTCEDEVFSISASSMTDNVTYLWEGPSSFMADVPNPVVTVPGSYMVTVTDPVNGCVTEETVVVIDGGDFPENLATTADVMMLSCDDLISELSAATSTLGVEITWSGPGINPTMAETIMVDEPGTYVASYFNPSNGCEITETITIDQDITVPMISPLTPDELNCQILEVALSVTNNEAIRTYQWEGPTVTSISGAADIASPFATESGIYSVTVTADDNGCTSVATVEVMQDMLIPVSVPSSFTITCDSMEVSLIGEGSTVGPTISYEWTNSANVVISTDLNTRTNIADTYTLTVFNSSNLCEVPEIVTVIENILEPTAEAGMDDDFACSDAFVTLTGSGTGQGILSYLWLNEIGAPVGTSASIDVVQSGIFTLIVTDAENGCTMMDQVMITPDENKPVPVIATPLVLTCDLMSVDLDASATTGIGTLSYMWTFNGNMAGDQAVITVGNPGTYTLMVLDASNGCDETSSIIVLENMEEPIFMVVGGEIDCIAGAIGVNLEGLNISSSDATFAWTGPGSFTADTEDLTDIDIEGDYIVVVTDMTNGCTQTATATVTASMDAPDASIGFVEMLDCDTEVVQLNGMADAGLSFSWTGPSATAIVSGETTLNPIVREPGDYTLVVTNSANGCSTVQSIEVEENPNMITGLDAEGVDVNCFGPNTGSIVITPAQITGGTAPFVYSIDGGENFSTSNTFLGLTAGIYDVVVMDVNGCDFPSTVNINPAEELILELGENQVIAFGDSIILNAQDNSNFDIDVIEWSDTLLMGQMPFAQPINTTSYEVTAFDENGCIATDNITIFVEKTRPVFIPNAFSPNRDGVNDIFTVFADLELIVKIKNLSVYNRWGEKVFEREEMTPAEALLMPNGWDGSFRDETIPGVYVYHVLVEFIDGEEIFYEGDVTSVR